MIPINNTLLIAGIIEELSANLLKFKLFDEILGEFYDY